jgi:amidase
VAGVNPLAPTFDTVGILVGSADVLSRVAWVLLAYEHTPREEPATIHLLSEALSIVDSDVRQVFDASVQHLRNLFGGRLRVTSLEEIDSESGGVGLQKWYDTYCVL